MTDALRRPERDVTGAASPGPLESESAELVDAAAGHGDALAAAAGAAAEAAQVLAGLETRQTLSGRGREAWEEKGRAARRERSSTERSAAPCCGAAAVRRNNSKD